jgi:periplasmic divalent cation tolerance protein
MSDSSHVNVNSEVVLVLSTFSDLATAEICAKHLVEHSNAACVQIDGPMRSVYQWKGDIQTDEEFRLLVKTSPESLNECVTALKEHHPYELPEIVVLHAHASAAYASWVTEQTTGRK